jgi:hypothetical protein
LVEEAAINSSIFSGGTPFVNARPSVDVPKRQVPPRYFCQLSTGSDLRPEPTIEEATMHSKRIISALIVVCGALAAAALNGGFPWGP